jgi:hypothetical protein
LKAAPLSPLQLSLAIKQGEVVEPSGFKQELGLFFLRLLAVAVLFFLLQVGQEPYFKRLEVEQVLSSLQWEEPRLYSLPLEGQVPFSLQLGLEVASVQLLAQLYSHWVF